MKKLLILAAAVAAFVSCQKENPNGESFSKAEVRVEVLNYAKTGAVDPSFFDYVTFEVKYREFAENSDPDNDSKFEHPEKFKTCTINASNPSLVITCTKKPTASNDFCADVVVTPVFGKSFPASFTPNFSVTCAGVIYNAAGNELRRTEAGFVGGTYPFTETTFKNLFDSSSRPDWVKTRLSYGYVQRYKTTEWFYNFGVGTFPADK